MLGEISKTNNGLQPFTPTMGKLISSLDRLKIASSGNLCPKQEEIRLFIIGRCDLSIDKP